MERVHRGDLSLHNLETLLMYDANVLGFIKSVKACTITVSSFSKAPLALEDESIPVIPARTYEGTPLYLLQSEALVLYNQDENRTLAIPLAAEIHGMVAPEADYFEVSYEYLILEHCFDSANTSRFPQISLSEIDLLALVSRARKVILRSEWRNGTQSGVESFVVPLENRKDVAQSIVDWVHALDSRVGVEHVSEKTIKAVVY